MGEGTLRLRGPVLAFLALSAMARSADAVAHPDLSYVPFVLALYVLPAWYGSGLGRATWQRYRWWLLGAQAVLTVVPFALFGSGWVTGVSYVLGGLVLLSVRSPWSWLVFAGIGALELAVRLRIGLPVEPAALGAEWVVNVYVNSGLMLFGMVRLGDMVARLDAARSELVDAAVAHQRLATANRLRLAVDTRLEVVVRHGLDALAELDTAPERAKAALHDAGVVARRAVADARQIVGSAVDGGVAGPATEEVVAPRLARAIVTIVIFLFALQSVLNSVAPQAGFAKSPAAAAVVLLAAPLIAAMVLWHSGLHTGGRRPSGWQWTLATQLAATAAAYAVSTINGLIFTGFLAGSALLLINHPLRWLAYGAALSSIPLAVLAEPVRPIPSWTIYAIGIHGAAGLAVYGLSRLAAAAVQLAAARAELAELAAVREQLRMARDTHDLLGLGLSAVALKTDLAATLVDIDPERARAEIDDLLRVAAAARVDARSVTDDTLRLSLATELRVTSDVLTAAGVEIHCPDVPADLPTGADAILATVLREAVTNVLRHSSARRVDVTIETGARITLAVRNDGAGDGPDAPGRGLSNLRERLAAVGGVLTADRHGEAFELRAEIPADRPAMVPAP